MASLLVRMVTYNEVFLYEKNNFNSFGYGGSYAGSLDYGLVYAAGQQLG